MASDPPFSIECFTLGVAQTNCYLVVGPAPGRGWVVDCGWGAGSMLERAERLGITIEAVVLTHAHFDHISGLGEARAQLGSAGQAPPVMIHEAEGDWLADPALNLSIMLADMLPGPEGRAVSTEPPERLLADGDRLELAGTIWSVLHTPGHSPGGISLLWTPEPGGMAGEQARTPTGPATGPVAFVGDALFNGSIGRTDFPNCDHDLLLRSIRERLFTLPADTRCLTGHGPETTIGQEISSNPFLR